MSTNVTVTVLGCDFHEIISHLLMGIAEIPNGLFKIKFRGRHHLMRVRGDKKNREFKIDNLPYDDYKKLYAAEDYIDVISQLSEKELTANQIKNPRITIVWEDKDQREFRMTVRDVWGLKKIFEEFPFLKLPFNYLPKK